MKIRLAQVWSEQGDVQRNIDHHLALLRTLELGSADLVAFPELSLTNYDPGVARAAALDPGDDRLAAFQAFADETGTAVAAGAPLKTAGKPLIALLVFAPGRSPAVVGKGYLHADEVPFFSAFEGGVGVLDLAARIGVAICYEISVAAHTAAVMAHRPALYLASVAKTPGGVAASRSTLSGIARTYGVPVLMVNSVGTCEGKAAGGGSMVIGRTGRLLAQLGEADEGFLTFDTETESAVVDA